MRQCAQRQSSGADQLRREIKALEALQRRGGITLVIDGDHLITVYSNDRRVFR